MGDFAVQSAVGCVAQVAACTAGQQPHHDPGCSVCLQIHKPSTSSAGVCRTPGAGKSLAVPQVLRSGGLGPLVRLLQHSEQGVQANGAGAIQSICFQVPLPASAPTGWMVTDGRLPSTVRKRNACCFVPLHVSHS